MISFKFIGMEVEATGSFSPSRPAPTVSNPDASGFSDPGDAAELYMTRAWFVDGINSVELSEEMLEFLREHEDKIIEQLQVGR